ncbi:MAG: hypothetical protein QME96_18300, partial [Myxococcota bacterium]|nr:hypothetical protein [Myxococcota bacterium]
GAADHAGPLEAATIVGGIVGVFAASVALGIVRFAFDRAIHNRLLRLISNSDGTLTADALVHAAARRGRDLLPGWAGARVRRRLLRLLRM